MTTRHLKIFLEVYTQGNMTAAAEQLYMSQPSVSQAIRDLEEHYGVPLFERLYHKLYPTPSGEKLFRYAGHILGLFRELEDNLQEEMKYQTLRVGCFFTAGMMAPAWLRRFRTDNPGCEVQMHVWKGAELRRLLRESKLDLAILEEDPENKDLIQEPFRADRLVIVASPDHPLTHRQQVLPADLAREPLLLREGGSGVRDQFEKQMRRAGLEISPVWQSSSSLVLLHAVREGEGLAVLPYELARDALDREQVAEVRVSGLNLRRRIAVTYHRDKYITPSMRSFIEIVKTGA